ncbi:ankyrin repeat domain-containing protein [Streptomyces sp. NPDC006510]|uniref:ankyrin repeat domain-containing protein n=1 Tax=Streptomyces sp. NPDC006510 TaxID=3155600 RepID=UPI0033B25E4A
MGENPLIAAVREGDVEAVGSLLAEGADPDTVGVQGIPALCLAVAAYDDPLAEVLMGAGADRDRRLADGSTPLMRAVDSGSLTLTRALFHAAWRAAPRRGSSTGRTGPGSWTRRTGTNSGAANGALRLPPGSDRASPSCGSSPGGRGPAPGCARRAAARSRSSSRPRVAALIGLTRECLSRSGRASGMARLRRHRDTGPCEQRRVRGRLRSTG